MQDFKSFSERLDFLEAGQFEELALELFEYQSSENEVYKSYLNARRIEPKKVNSVDSIPFLPIRFFKDFSVV